MAEPRDSMLDPKYLGGLIGGEGYAFQNAYVLYRLPDWLDNPAFAGLQPEGWEDVEVFYDDGQRREAIQVKDYAVTPGKAKEIFEEFQRRAGRGARDGIDYRFRLACVGISPTLQPVETAVTLLQARSGYTDAEKAGTRTGLATKVEELKLNTPAAFVEGLTFETDLGGVTQEDVLRDILSIRLYRAGYGLSLLGAEYAYVQLAAGLFRWLQKARYVKREDIEAIIEREAERHPERPAAEPSPAYTYDVFVSYTRADGAWVREELLPKLAAAGLKACAEFEGCQADDAQLKRAVLASRRTLLLLTPEYLDQAWPAFEALMLGAWDRADRADRLVLARRAECERPLLVRYLPYVDVSPQVDQDAAWAQLLTALGAAPEPEAPPAPAPAAWCLKHPYPMPPNFTGRETERAMLRGWLEPAVGRREPPLLVVRALGGFGKSALAWHWLLHDVEAARWPRVVWWSFYDERDFNSFLRETLEYLIGEGATHLAGESHDLARALHLNPRAQADKLLDHLRQPGTLLILDGFERALRAYSNMDAAYQGDADPAAGDAQYPIPNTQYTDCVSPIAEHFLRNAACLPGLQGKVLLTTRLRPRVLEAQGGDLLAGCREEVLKQMQPADAVAFFRAQGVRGGRAEIERACAPYGYHPLSLRLLAGLVVRDLRQPGDIGAARRLDVMGDLQARQHHVLEQAYTNLDAKGQKLLSTIACFRGPVGYEALKQTFRVSETLKVLDVDDALRELVARGLLHQDRKTGKYDLHPIVRRYAYDRLGGGARAEAHGQLRDYFAAVPPPDRVATLEDLASVIELYHHTVQVGQYDEARTLFGDRLVRPLYFQFGAYQQCIELLRALFPDGEDQPPRLESEKLRSWTVDILASSYSLSGQPRRAVPLYEQGVASDEKMGDKRNLAVGLGNLATQQVITGALRDAEANQRRRIALCREIEDEFREAVGHQSLGRLLAYCGAWAEAEEELAASTRFWERTSDYDGVCIDEAYRSLRALLMDDPHTALYAAKKSLQAWEEDARRSYPTVRTLVRTKWLLGAAHRATGDLDAAEHHLNEALTRCRGINMVDHEADILLDVARLRHAQGKQDDALRDANEALIITERSGYVLQGADVHLFLAEMEMEIEIERGDRERALEKALDHAQKARALATCDGPPEYTYKVAYEEAGALLGRLGA